MIRFPATDGDDLVLFGYGRVEFKDIGLNRVWNAVDLLRVDPEAGKEGFQEIGGVRGFDSNGRQKF